MNLGTTTVNVISDGTILIDGGRLFGAVPRVQWEVFAKPDRRNRVRLGINTLLIQTPKLNILVDTGAGSKRPEKYKGDLGINGNKLHRGLKGLGLTPRDIDVVILTHLHVEHGGGCTKLDRSGRTVPAFPKARYLVQRACWEEACSANGLIRDQVFQDDFMPLEEKGVVEFLDGDAEIIPGVSAIVTDGHSKGHQIVLVEWGSERIAFLGDLIPTPYHLPLHHIAALDLYPIETYRRKQELMERAVEDGWLVVFGHGNDHRAGYIQKRNGKPCLIPVDV